MAWPKSPVSSSCNLDRRFLKLPRVEQSICTRGFAFISLSQTLAAILTPSCDFAPGCAEKRNEWHSQINYMSSSTCLDSVTYQHS